MNSVRRQKGLLSIIMTLMVVLAMIPNTVFADTVEKNLVDYTGLQQGTTSTRIYMLNCGTLETDFPNVFADKNEYTSRWNIKVNTNETTYFDNYILDKPDSRKEIEFVFSIGGSGMNHLDITKETFRKGITDYVKILDSEGNELARDIDMVFTPHPGSGGGTGSGPSRAVDVIVKVAPNTLNADEIYRFAILSGLSSGKNALDKDIYFTFATAPILAESVTLDKTSITLDEGKTETIAAKVTPDNVTNSSVVWSSSDETIATVDENGNVKAVKAGTAVIKATSGDGQASAECQITVKAVAKDNGAQGGAASGSDKSGGLTNTGDPMSDQALFILVALMILAAGTMVVVVRKRQRQ